MILHRPNFKNILDKKVSIAVAAGERSKDASFARTTFPQADYLGCPRFVMPGNHSGFDGEPEAFAEKLIEAFDSMDKKRG